jgi:hypothetical protein
MTSEHFSPSSWKVLVAFSLNTQNNLHMACQLCLASDDFCHNMLSNRQLRAASTARAGVQDHETHGSRPQQVLSIRGQWKKGLKKGHP